MWTALGNYCTRYIRGRPEQAVPTPRGAGSEARTEGRAPDEAVQTSREQAPRFSPAGANPSANRANERIEGEDHVRLVRRLLLRVYVSGGNLEPAATPVEPQGKNG